MVDNSVENVCFIGSVERYKVVFVYFVFKLEFDFIILGMGQDGYIVLFFFKLGLLKDNENLVVMIINEFSVKRMIFLFFILNKVRYIVVIVSGYEKYDIVDFFVGSEKKNVNKYFILGVNF